MIGNKDKEKKRKSQINGKESTRKKSMGKKCKTANQDNKLQQEFQSQRVNAILAKRSLPLGQLPKEVTEVIRDEEEENIPPSFNPQQDQTPSQSVLGNPGNTQQTQQYSPHSQHSKSMHTPIQPRTNSILPPVTVLPSTTTELQSHAHSSMPRSLTPLRATSTPTNNHIQLPPSQRPSSSYMSMLEDDGSPYDTFGITPLKSQEIHVGGGHGNDWDSESFASHFTQEFESLKAEVDTLRTEVKFLRKIVREIRQTRCQMKVKEMREAHWVPYLRWLKIQVDLLMA